MSAVKAVKGGPRQHNVTGRASREEMLRVAEALFAEQGIEAVSFRQVSQRAGQHGNGAAQYYFGDRAGLTLAIIQHRSAGHDDLRNSYLDRLDGIEPIPVRGLIEALVRPVARHIAAPDDHYVGFLDRYYALYRYGKGPIDAVYAPAMNRLIHMFQAALPELDADAVRSRLGLVVRWMVSALAGIERAVVGGELAEPLDAAVEEVIDLLAAAALADRCA